MVLMKRVGMGDHVVVLSSEDKLGIVGGPHAYVLLMDYLTYPRCDFTCRLYEARRY